MSKSPAYAEPTGADLGRNLELQSRFRNVKHRPQTAAPSTG